MDYIFFMCAIRHSEIETLEKMLIKYIDASASYIIAMETAKDSHSETQGEHFHFAVQMDDKQYERFRHTVFTNHYKLRGRATDGKPRQYGKVKEIRDQTKFLAYTVKDQNIVYRNIDLKDIQDYIEVSYPRRDVYTFQASLMKHLVNNQINFAQLPGIQDHLAIDKIEIEILNYCMAHEKVLSRSFLKQMTSTYLQIHMPDRYKYLEDIYFYIKHS